MEKSEQEKEGDNNMDALKQVNLCQDQNVQRRSSGDCEEVEGYSDGEDLEIMEKVEKQLQQCKLEALSQQYVTESSTEHGENTSNASVMTLSTLCTGDVLSATGAELMKANADNSNAKDDVVMSNGLYHLEMSDITPVQENSQYPPTLSIPLTTLTRSVPLSNVGAYAVGGESGSHVLSIHSHNSDHTNNNARAENLVVANPVHDIWPEHPEDLPMAESVDANNPLQKGAARIKETKTYALLVIIVVAAIVVILVAVLISRAQESYGEVDPDSIGPTSSPSQLSTTVEQYYLSLLPESTVSVIMEVPDSPQANAFQWLMQDVSVWELTHDRIKQRFALATLFYATNGEMWVGKNKWLNHSADECEWETKPDFGEKNLLSAGYKGFLSEMFPSTESAPTTCNEDGLIQHLWLDKNNLRGTLPLELYMLTSLKTLSFGGNSLPGSISSHIGQLTLLEGWSTRDVEFSGQIPTEIGLLSNLSVFILNKNNHEGPMPRQVWQLTNMATISWGANPNLKGTIPSEINAMSNLRWFGLTGCGFTGTVPSTIGLLKQLEWIEFLDNKFSGTLPSEIGQLTKATLLSVYGNALEGSLPTEMGLLTGMDFFRIGDNQFTGPVPSELGLLTNLEVRLTLAYNQFSGKIPTELGLLTRLTALDLHGNQLSGKIPSELGSLTELGTLTLANNSLSGSFPWELVALQSSLYALSFEGNALLSGNIPGGLCSINGTCVEDPLRMCELMGLSFDCGYLLCGCNCSCLDG